MEAKKKFEQNKTCKHLLFMDLSNCWIHKKIVYFAHKTNKLTLHSLRSYCLGKPIEMKGAILCVFVCVYGCERFLVKHKLCDHFTCFPYIAVSSFFSPFILSGMVFFLPQFNNVQLFLRIA